MTSIDRIGQKVVCVYDSNGWQSFCCGMASWPSLGDILTVSGFGLVEDMPGIWLYELPPIDCSCCGLSGAPLADDLLPATRRARDRHRHFQKDARPGDGLNARPWGTLARRIPGLASGGPISAARLGRNRVYARFSGVAGYLE